LTSGFGARADAPEAALTVSVAAIATSMATSAARTE
jgi:hypothetical protein